MQIKIILIAMMAFTQFITPKLALAADEMDNLSLSMVLRAKKFSPKYALNRLNIGKIEEESYMTEDISLKIRKPFLKDVKGQGFRYWKKYFLSKGGFNASSLLNKGAKYKQLVENILVYHNLPKELYYLGLIESRYEFKIKSAAGARGPWQFLASTGREYGLIINRYYDERTNLIKSTHAAARYFKDLYNIFGSWELALSAYNAGEYGIIRRIRQARTKDFYQLSKRKLIPKETRNYIPKILALAHVDKYRSKYGLRVKKINSPLGRYENTYVVVLNKSHKLKKISSKIGVSLKSIRRLNPELRGFYTPELKKNQTYKLRLPRPRNERVIASAPVKSLRKKRRNLPTFHTVRSGENMSTIANTYSMPLAQLFIINHGLEKKTLHPGDKVRLVSKKVKKVTKRKPIKRKIKKVAKAIKKTVRKKKKKSSSYKYTVRKGDSLFSISMLFNVRIPDIKLKNAMKSNTIKPGKQLNIPGVKRSIHIVRKGEFLNKIATKYKNSINTIKKLNRLKTLQVRPGQKLVVLN